MVGVLVSGQLFLVFDIDRRLWHWKVITLNLSDELGQVFLGLQGQLDVVLLADEKLKGNGSRGFKVTWEADWNVDCQDINGPLDSLCNKGRQHAVASKHIELHQSVEHVLAATGVEGELRERRVPLSGLNVEWLLTRDPCWSVRRQHPRMRSWP